jgi:hypothetical protein
MSGPMSSRAATRLAVQDPVAIMVLSIEDTEVLRIELVGSAPECARCNVSRALCADEQIIRAFAKIKTAGLLD